MYFIYVSYTLSDKLVINIPESLTLEVTYGKFSPVTKEITQQIRWLNKYIVLGAKQGVRFYSGMQC